MRKSKTNTMVNHEDFVAEMRSLLNKYNLKFNTATVSSKDDSNNSILIRMYKENFFLPCNREWHDY